jgi:hypothetical protein
MTGTGMVVKVVVSCSFCGSLGIVESGGLTDDEDDEDDNDNTVVEWIAHCGSERWIERLPIVIEE